MNYKSIQSKLKYQNLTVSLSTLRADFPILAETCWENIFEFYKNKLLESPKLKSNSKCSKSIDFLKQLSEQFNETLDHINEDQNRLTDRLTQQSQELEEMVTTNANLTALVLEHETTIKILKAQLKSWEIKASKDPYLFLEMKSAEINEQS